MSDQIDTNTLQVKESIFLEELRTIESVSEEKLDEYLNHFWLKFAPLEPGEINERTALQSLNRMKMKLAEYFSGEALKPYSELRKNQSNEEYYATVDQVFNALDTDGSLAELLKNIKNEKKSGSVKQLRKIANQKLKPVYARLRAMGYNHYELSVTS